MICRFVNFLKFFIIGKHDQLDELLLLSERRVFSRHQVSSLGRVVQDSQPVLSENISYVHLRSEDSCRLSDVLEYFVFQAPLSSVFNRFSETPCTSLD